MGKRGRIAWLSLLLTALGFGGGHWAIAAFQRDYELGVDLQQVSCLPWRVFLVTREVAGRQPQRGDIVRFVSRGLEPHFQDGWVISKMVGAVAGDRVEVKDDRLYVNGVFWDWLWLNGYLAVDPGHFDRAFTVREGEVLLLATDAASYDGRYWGTLPIDRIDGYVRPLL